MEDTAKERRRDHDDHFQMWRHTPCLYLHELPQTDRRAESCASGRIFPRFSTVPVILRKESWKVWKRWWRGQLRVREGEYVSPSRRVSDRSASFSAALRPDQLRSILARKKQGWICQLDGFGRPRGGGEATERGICPSRTNTGGGFYHHAAGNRRQRVVYQLTSFYLTKIQGSGE